MNLSELFSQLDNAISDMNNRKDAYAKSEAETAKLYEDYKSSYKAADAIKTQLQTTLGNALPASAPERSVVR